jgi:hypothetical protein
MLINVAGQSDNEKAEVWVTSEWLNMTIFDKIRSNYPSGYLMDLHIELKDLRSCLGNHEKV